MMAAALSSFILLLFAGGLTLSVSLFVGRVLRGRPLLEMVPRRPVPWGFLDLWCLWLFLGLTALGIAHQVRTKSQLGDIAASPLTLEQAREMLLMDTVLKLILAGIMFGWIHLRHRPTATDWGWSLHRIRDDAVIGIATFLVIYLPTIAIQACLVYLLEWKYDHPLIEVTTETKDPLLFLLAFFVAAIMAPLFEEFIFRGLLQGWFENAFSRHLSSHLIWKGGIEPGLADIAVREIEPQSPQESLPQNEVVWIDPNPYASPGPVREILFLADTPPLGPNWLAIAVSSIIFALMHFSHGPSWIPLLLFGAALGYVYQRTHSLWPGIIAHMLLNGTTMIGLWVEVFGEK